MKKRIALSIPIHITITEWLVLGNGFAGRRAAYNLGNYVQIIARPPAAYSNRFHFEEIDGLGLLSMGAGWLHDISQTNPQTHIKPLLDRARKLNIPLIETDYSKHLLISENGTPISETEMGHIKSRISSLLHMLHELKKETPNITLKEAFSHIPKENKDEIFWTLIAASIEDWNAFSYAPLILKNELEDLTYLFSGILGRSVANGYIPAHETDEKDYLVLGNYFSLLDPIDHIPSHPFTIKGIYPQDGWVDVVTEENGIKRIFSSHHCISCIDAHGLKGIKFNKEKDFLAPDTRTYLNSLQQGYYEKVFIKINDTTKIPTDKHFISIVSKKKNRGLCSFMINLVALTGKPILAVFLSGPRAQELQKNPAKTLKKIQDIIQSTFKTDSEILGYTEWQNSPFSGSYVHREAIIPGQELTTLFNNVFTAGGWTNRTEVDTVTAALLSVQQFKTS